MEDEYNEYFYNYKCDVCGVISKEKVRILKDKQSLELFEPRITDDFCSNGHRIIIPKGNYKPIGKELVLLDGN